MLSGKKLILLGAIVVLLAAIPLTLYFVSKQNEVRSRATPATTLSFDPTSDTTNPIRKNVGDTFVLDVRMDPGSNVVSFAKLNITYDPTKVATASPGIEAISGTSSVANTEGAVYHIINGVGSATINLGIVVDANVADPTKAIRTSTRIAKITFRALSLTDTAPTSINFGNLTQVLSTNQSQDAQGENVLSTKNPALIAIAASTLSPTPTGIISITPTSLTPTPTLGATGTNQPPVCSALNVDRATTGVAPFPITFTANGTDPDGTVNRVTFDFGDGPVSDLKQSGGIGTKTVSAQISHTYNNAGNFTATATLTDNNGGVSSASASCSQNITVTAASGSASVTPTLTQLPPLETISTPTPTSVVIASPGPQNQIISLGAIGAALSIIGAIIFFAL